MRTKKITKAVIPAAGLGTRMLPIARTVCKETLPIVDRPAISYLVNEAIESGATDILIITNRGKGAIEDYFDYSPEYEIALRAKGKDALVDELRRDAERANIYFIRQKEPRGLGHAVLAARNFIGDEPFYVLYGDDVIMSETPVCAQLRDAYEKYGKAACGVKEVTAEQILKYSSLDAKPIESRHDRKAEARGGYYPPLDSRQSAAYARYFRHPRRDKARRGRRDTAHRRNARACTLGRYDGGRFRGQAL